MPKRKKLITVHRALFEAIDSMCKKEKIGEEDSLALFYVYYVDFLSRNIQQCVMND